MDWSLRFLGVGNASAVELGSPMSVIERDGRPWLTIDCGGEGLTAFKAHYGHMPQAVFVTHVHLDHVAGFERLFVDTFFNAHRRGKVRLYVPATVVPLLHKRIGDYPNVLAEGGANFWDAFQLIVVGEAFWHEGVRLEVFPVRHHWPETAYGLRLQGALTWSGDTRPIPEMLARFANDNELIAHDCGLHGNPSHTGVDDLEREYSAELQARMMLYHYASVADGQALAARGHRVAQPGQCVPLASPTAPHVLAQDPP